MSIAIDSIHLQYFRENGKIEFEKLLSPRELDALLVAIQKNSSPTSPFTFSKGFDLFRQEPELKKIFCSYKLANLAGQLIQKKKIRFGFSQILNSSSYHDKYSFLYRKSCIKNITCGVCIALKPATNPENPYFPTEVGHSIFFEVDDDFFTRFPKTDGIYLFIFYAEHKSFYSFQENDPINAQFRNMGYQHGDFLREPLHPAYSWMPV